MAGNDTLPHPNHVMPEKSLWIDVNKRTLVVWRVWSGSPSTLELLVLNTVDAMKWVTLSWPEAYRMIQDGRIQRCERV